MLRKTLLAICLLLISYGAISQLTENHFSDTEPKEGGKIMCSVSDGTYIYTGGLGTEISMQHPFVSKVDTLGNTLWNTADNDTTIYKHYAGKVWTMFLSGSYIYALIRPETAFNYPTPQVWKIDANTGSIMWRTEINATYYNQLYNIIDYNSSKIIIYYSNSNNTSNYSFISKANGNILSTKSTLEIGGFAVDSHKDLYYTAGNTVYKYSGANPNTQLWAKSFTSLSISKIHRIYIDSNDSLYLIGLQGTSSGGPSFVLCLQPASGNLNWSTYDSYNSGVYPTDLVDHGGYLHITWKSVYAGGGTRFNASKFNKQSGTHEWNRKYLFTGNSTFGTGNNGQKGALSLDVDTNGDVYLTGYYGTYSSYNKGAWGILKLNGNNGNVIYDRTITQDSSIHDEGSCGIGTTFINNKAYFVGSIETDTTYKLTRHCFVEMDPASGNIVNKVLLGGKFQEPSFTKAIRATPTNDIVVLKQIGKKVRLEAYNQSKTLLWHKEFTDDVFLKAFDVQINDQGTIYVCAYSHPRDYYPPYYEESNMDSAYIFSLDPNGQVVGTARFAGGNYTSLVQLKCGFNNAGFILYERNGLIHFRKFQGNSLNNEINTYSSCHNTLFEKKLLGAYDLYNMAYLKNESVEVFLVKMNKSTGQIQNTNTPKLPFLHRASYLTELNNDTLIILGERHSNQYIIAFSKSQSDTIWTKKLGSEFSLSKVIVDNRGKYIYTLATKNNMVNIRKYRGANGNLNWGVNYQENNSIKSTGKDICFDPEFGYIIYSGSNTRVTNGRIHDDLFINTIDTLGANLKTYKRPADYHGNETASCLMKSSNSSVWIGGNMNHATYRKAGFVYYLDTNMFVTQSVYDTACFAYTSPSGNHIWTTSGVHSDTLWAPFGKDTIYSIDLNIISIDTSIYQYDSLLVSNQGYAKYQWIDAATMQALPGDTQSTFIAPYTGIFAVIIEYNGCIDTSEYKSVYYTSLDDLTREVRLTLAPNPCTDYISIESNSKIDAYELRDLYGKIIQSGSSSGQRISVEDISPGTYCIVFYFQNRYPVTRKIVIL